MRQRTAVVVSVLSVLALLASAAHAEWSVFDGLSLSIAYGVDATGPDNVVLAGGVNGNGASIVVSHDGFQTWEFQPTDPQFFYMSVSLASEQVGIAGSIGFYGQIASGSYRVDGKTWQGVGDDPLFSGVQGTHAYDNSTLLMFGWWQVDLATFFSGVAISYDAGRSFSYHNWGLQSPILARYGHAVSPSHWIVTGGAWPAKDKSPEARVGHLFERARVRFSDGGDVRTDYDTASKKNSDGYVGVIMVTTDGGATWRQVFYEEGRRYFNSVQCIRLRCWTVAEGPEGGWLLTSTDGGFTWTELYFHANISMTYADFLNENEGWIAGSVILPNTFESVFLHTIDGGRTWTQSPSILNVFPNTVTVVSSSRAYATAFLRNGLSALMIYDADETSVSQLARQ